MKEIILTQGKVALVDDEDYEMINKFKWFFHTGYASTNITEKGRQRTIKMHRYILNAQKGFMVDHINHNTIDNRKENLRISTNQQNLFNQKIKNIHLSIRGLVGLKVQKNGVLGLDLIKVYI